MALSAACSCALALLFVATLCSSLCSAEYPGVIELVGYSNRRARTHFMESPSPNPTLTPPAAKTRADIETVKRNMKKYDRLLELDTKNLPEPQKDMLARIVERVARLKETLDIEEQQLIQQEATSARSSSGSSSTQQLSTEELEQSTLPTTGYTETETDPTLLLDETTLLELQNTMNEQAALQAEVTAQTTLMREFPTTTDAIDAGETTVPALTTLAESSQETASDASEEESTTSNDSLTDATDADDQFVAARSNNNIAAITAADADPSTSTTQSAGNQRTLTTMGKLKLRPTKRPFGHKVTAALKRQGQRPSSVSAAAANAAAASKPPSQTATTIKQKQGTNSNNYAQKQTTKQQQQQQQQQKVTAAGNTQQPATMTTANSQAPALPLEQLYTRTPQANIPAAAAAAASVAAAAAAATPAASSYTNSNSNPSESIVYDGHVNASALIDSLNTHAREEYYQQKLAANGGSSSNIGNGNGNSNNKDNKKTATAKPTKYHYYPHNQHIYLLPECAIQQVCNAVYVRLNYTQPLCACPSRYRDPCSASLNEDDQHTTKLVGDNKKKAITLAKTCEATTEMRECRSPKDWSLLALQNTRTGKSHYLVICRCPDHFKMEGPMAHDQPTYASVPGIRVFGMMCVKPGYSVRKPSAQPPKRYQLQKPFYRPSVNGGGLGAQKDTYVRPIYGGGSSGSQVGSSAISANYQPQDQSFANGGGSSSYQYLNRPESTHNTHSSPNFRPDQFTLSGFPGSNYGRNNERRGEAPPIEAAAEERDGQTPSSSTQASDELEARTTLQADSNLNSELSESPAELTTLPDSSRVKRALDAALDDFEPEFPWDRVLEFQQTIVWD
ncbi:uncharacterized protein LOC133843356 [Drosophila sulfurigaster albostrigata]|uniref:uncharacterized protein LOC133843356 n=1 Tax=Drosophila sulfurigaster albostrigata TaxID=89887 RepID=UPI002D218D7B|nr:uncharacterized protein LOC133843356 [Drosophila sulfurigaster albostrigata]